MKYMLKPFVWDFNITDVSAVTEVHTMAAGLTLVQFSSFQFNYVNPYTKVI